VKKTFLSLLAALTFAPWAQSQFVAGDLIMSFQATGGQGASQTIAANLGAAYSWRDATANSFGVIDLGTLLTVTYGASWFDRTDLYFTINGVRAAGYNPANGGSPVVDGDARNAIYIGRSKTSSDPLSYSPYTYTASAMGNVGTQMTTYNATVGTALSSVAQATIAASEINTIEDFTIPNSGGARLVNWTTFSADANQAFTAGTLFSNNGFDYAGALNLQRINRVDGTTGTLAGNVVFPGISAGTGANLGYFGIRDSGIVDYYAVPEPSTYTLLVLTAAGLAAHATRRRRRQP